MAVGLPQLVGSVKRQTATQLAEGAIEKLSGHRRNADFAVTYDLAGRLWIDYPHNAPVREVIATVNRKSDPDWLAEEIRFEKRVRGDECLRIGGEA